jgi:hypothetical protein
MNRLRQTAIAAGLVLASLPFASALQAQQTESSANAAAYIVSPQNGDTVNETFTVIFGLNEMGVAPAGIEMAETGHHHLLVDKATMPAMNQPLGADVMHFGKGQTQVELTLEPGEHTLQLILGDHLHIPHNPPVVSEKITITVE